VRRTRGRPGAKTGSADRCASRRRAQAVQESDQPTEVEEPDSFEVSDDTPLSIPGIAKFGRLYEIYGRHSDRRFPERVFGGEPFRRLLEHGADEDWLRTLCTGVDDLRYRQRFLLERRRELYGFRKALRKTVAIGEGLHALPSGNAYGKFRHELLRCMGVMQQGLELLDAFCAKTLWWSAPLPRGAAPDWAAEHFRWQVDHFPWVSRPPDLFLVQLYRELTGKVLEVDSFRRARRRDRRAKR
jgi:hypothetical protein